MIKTSNGTKFHLVSFHNRKILSQIKFDLISIHYSKNFKSNKFDLISIFIKILENQNIRRIKILRFLKHQVEIFISTWFRKPIIKYQVDKSTLFQTSCGSSKY